jgi:hypothetical protein
MEFGVEDCDGYTLTFAEALESAQCRSSTRWGTASRSMMALNK